MRRLVALVVASLPFAAAMAADTYSIDPRHTYATFKIVHFGYSTQHGRFNGVSGKFTLDAAAGTGKIEAVVDVNSLDMALDELTTHLRSPDFFNAAQFPTIRFASEKLKFEGGNLVGATGSLTLHGVTRPVQLTVSGFKCGNNPMNQKAMCGGNVSTSIKRSDFGMTTFLPAIADEVEIEIPIEAYKE
jgi:polyisoprenoid-binding protein YceI